jgi:hypothetical protein
VWNQTPPFCKPVAYSDARKCRHHTKPFAHILLKPNLFRPLYQTPGGQNLVWFQNYLQTVIYSTCVPSFATHSSLTLYPNELPLIHRPLSTGQGQAKPCRGIAHLPLSSLASMLHSHAQPCLGHPPSITGHRHANPSRRGALHTPHRPRPCRCLAPLERPRGTGPGRRSRSARMF